MKKKTKRDVEKNYPIKQFIAKMKRLAKSLQQGKSYTLQVAGERIIIPKQAVITIEHERGAKVEEVEFQLKWKIEQRKKK